MLYSHIYFYIYLLYLSHPPPKKNRSCKRLNPHFHAEIRTFFTQKSGQGSVFHTIWSMFFLLPFLTSGNLWLFYFCIYLGKTEDLIIALKLSRYPKIASQLLTFLWKWLKLFFSFIQKQCIGELKLPTCIQLLFTHISYICSVPDAMKDVVQSSRVDGQMNSQVQCPVATVVVMCAAGEEKTWERSHRSHFCTMTRYGKLHHDSYQSQVKTQMKQVK